jgi:hypothetical protein
MEGLLIAMKQYEQAIATLIVSGFAIMLIADVLKQIMWYLVVFAFLAVIFRLLLRNH